MLIELAMKAKEQGIDLKAVALVTETEMWWWYPRISIS